MVPLHRTPSPSQQENAATRPNPSGQTQRVLGIVLWALFIGILIGIGTR